MTGLPDLRNETINQLPATFGLLLFRSWTRDEKVHSPSELKSHEWRGSCVKDDARTKKSNFQFGAF